jgi:hypothetical protein
MITAFSERCGVKPGHFKACWITLDPFIVSSALGKQSGEDESFVSPVSHTGCLLVFVSKQKRTPAPTRCQEPAESVYISL